MVAYSTIVPVSRHYWPAGSLAYGGTCEGSVPYPETWSSNYPTNESLEYQPVTESSFVHDPTKGLGRKWSEIKRSGHISFTPYSRQSIKTTNFMVTRKYDKAQWKVHRQGCIKSQTANQFGPAEGHTIYYRNSTIVEYVNGIDYSKLNLVLATRDNDISDAIATTQQSAFVNSTSSYDALTEIAEMGETLKFAQSSIFGAASSLRSLVDKDPHTWKRARRLNGKQLLSSSDKALRTLGSRWMAYRYAIMPVYYSFRDINELYNNADDEYQTGRSKKKLSHSLGQSSYVIPAEHVGTYVTTEISTTVTSTWKVRYSSGSLQRLFSQVQFNPLATAYELIPLSFVADWLWSLNDSIVSATRIDSSDESTGVTAIRTSRIDKVMLYDFSVDRATQSLGAWYTAPAYTVSYNYARQTNEPLQEVHYESYNRFIYSRPKPVVVFDPSLNWKRLMDALVLSHQPIKNLLRSLR